jgi:hypothetical protein
MTVGDRVRVYPHGSPALASVGKVVVISENQRSIAVALDHLPRIGAGAMAIHPGLGAVLLIATRQEVGPWVDLLNQGHYEIEEASE